MDLGISDRVKPILDDVKSFIVEELEPVYPEFLAEQAKEPRWGHTDREIEIMNSLKEKAKNKGLWNFFLPESKLGAGLNNVDYAHLAEAMGWNALSSACFNCAAPDSGNMEVLERYGNEEQKEKWLKPLLDGKIRSAFAMTEPGVASSDATNIEAKAELVGEEWVINGEKYYISGAGDVRCKILIAMVVTDPDATKYSRQSQILVPMDTPGVEIVRPMHVFGHDGAPNGHMHIKFEDVHVPKDHLLLGRGRGFEIAQGRLGPGRIHHCMRSIGVAEKALQLMCRRASSRVAFGKALADLGGNIDVIAKSRIEINQARLLTLKAAHLMDTIGNRKARSAISEIKYVVPNMALAVIDRAIQMHGASGVSQDFPLAGMWTSMRTLRLADGPDEAHLRVVGRTELDKYRQRDGDLLFKVGDPVRQEGTL